MDILDEELLGLWKCLNQCNVKYIMVGGFATTLHGFNRTTEDVDIWLEDTLINRQRMRAAFNCIGYGDVAAIETMQFLPGWTSFHLSNGLELDIMTNMKGLEDLTFTACLELASLAEIEGIQIPFLHINQLIANKKAVNRPKDQIDVVELEKIKKIREGE